MKKKNKKNQIRKRFSTLLLCILAILLCAAPCNGAAFSISFNEGNHDVTEEWVNDEREKQELGEGGLDWLEVYAGATVNLYTDVSQYVYAYPGSILNIHSGNVGYIAISPPRPDESNAVVTVYGTDFAVSNGTIQPDGNWTPDSKVGSGTLTGYYGGGDGSSINLWIFSDTPINLQPPQPVPSSGPAEIQIDIKPGGNPNNINPRSKGVVPVAILSTETFNASNVDPESVTFAGAESERWRLCDVDGIGDLDMLFHFKTKKLFEKDLNENSTEATLTGDTFGGDTVIGTDKVWIVPRKK